MYGFRGGIVNSKAIDKVANSMLLDIMEKNSPSLLNAGNLEAFGNSYTAKSLLFKAQSN